MIALLAKAEADRDYPYHFGDHGGWELLFLGVLLPVVVIFGTWLLVFVLHALWEDSTGRHKIDNWATRAEERWTRKREIRRAFVGAGTDLEELERRSLARAVGAIAEESAYRELGRRRHRRQGLDAVLEEAAQSTK